MAVTIEEISELERRCAIPLPAQEIEQALQARLNRLARTTHIKGFRRGKVPAALLRQRYGAELRHEVIEELTRKLLQDTLQEHGLRVAGAPSLKVQPAGGADPEGAASAEGKELEGDLECMVTFEVYPEVTLVGYKELAVERAAVEVSDQDVEEMVGRLRRQAGQWEVVDSRPAQDGDRLTIDFSGTLDGGEVFEGGSGKEVQVELGSGAMIPGFEEGLQGLKAGARKTLSLVFPEDYHEDSLKGRKARFDVHVRQVEALQPAPLDDDLFSRYGMSGASGEEFAASVRRGLERQVKQLIEEQVKTGLVEQLLKAHVVNLPKSLVAEEIEDLRHRTLTRMGIDTTKVNPLELLPDDHLREEAGRRVKTALLLGEVAKEEKLSADREAVGAKLQELAMGQPDPQEFIRLCVSSPQQMNLIHNMVLEDAVVAKLLAFATIKDQPRSCHDLLGWDQRPPGPALSAADSAFPQQTG